MCEEKPIEQHYSTRLKEWIDEYENPCGHLFATLRLARILDFLEKKSIKPKHILDVGCGIGVPSMKVAQPASFIYGFDLSPELVEYAGERAKRLNLKAEYVVGSAADPSAYPDRSFEMVLALGVFQHIVDDVAVLELIQSHLEPDGWAILSFRNPLFGLVTFNRPSYELFGELFREFLESEDAPVLDEFLKSKLDLSLPPVRKGSGDDPQVDDLVRKYHNPLTLEDLLAKAGLTAVHKDFYRHHAAPPLLEKRAPEKFEELSRERDRQANDWRSIFLCSTYLVYCRHA
jgi:ubiquinone/menaquinone biosynthesis C-methylase UbiE